MLRHAQYLPGRDVVWPDVGAQAALHWLAYLSAADEHEEYESDAEERATNLLLRGIVLALASPEWGAAVWMNGLPDGPERLRLRLDEARAWIAEHPIEWRELAE